MGPAHTWWQFAITLVVAAWILRKRKPEVVIARATVPVGPPEDEYVEYVLRHPSHVDQHVVVFAGDAHSSLLAAASPKPCVFVNNRTEFQAAANDAACAAAFIDADLLYQVAGDLPAIPVPTIAIVDGTPSEARSNIIRALDSFSRLSHVIAVTMLSTSRARSHLAMVLQQLATGPKRPVATGVGRVALLAQANRREARFERMHEFFSKHGLSARTISAIGEVSEELVMNALYDAPVEAGYFKTAIPRTTNVDLPAERACEISYGVEDGNVFVRLRDTFGALTRQRLLEVLTRCNMKGVALDESRGGAGLGLWRIFSTASTIAITVVPGRLTDIIITIAPKEAGVARQLLTVNLFFASTSNDELECGLPNHDLIDKSVTLVLQS